MSSDRQRSIAAAVLLGGVLAGLAAAGTAQARTEVVSWSHVSPCMLDGFELRYGTSPGNLTTVIDVGLPRQAGGHFSYPLELPDQDQVYVCVAAVRGADKSVCSDSVTLAPSTVGSPRSEPAPGEENRSWCEDFNDGDPPGWVDTGPDSSLTSVPGLFGVTALGGSNYAFSTSATGNDVHSHFLGTSNAGVPSSQWSRYEYSGQMQFADPSASIGVTLYSQFDASTGYYRLGRSAGGTFVLERDQLDPTYKCVAGVAPPPQGQPGVWYAFRVQVEDKGLHTRLQTKVWPAAKREPEGFQWSCTDTSSMRQLSGAVGVWSSGPGLKLWDDLYVAELADPAPGDPLGVPGKPALVP